MQVKNVNGQLVEIAAEELYKASAPVQQMHTHAEDGSSCVCNTPEHRNKAYKEKALSCIEHITGEKPCTEQEKKNLMYRKLSLGTMQETNLLYEFIESIIADHFEKIHAIY